jgi:hypothetical protein
LTHAGQPGERRVAGGDLALPLQEQLMAWLLRLEGDRARSIEMSEAVMERLRALGYLR